MERNKIHHKKKIILLFVVITIIFCIAYYNYNLLNKISYVPLDEEKELSISPEIPKYEETEILNVLLFGLDSRVEGQRSRSDAIIIATLDTKEKKIKLSSLMRDTYVSIPDRQDNRINAAYAFGGPQLAIRTVNENYNMNIEKYVTVDFFSLEKIINKLGGVEIEIKEYEIGYINNVIRDLNNDYEDDIDSMLISESGKHNLDGRQAVAYSRVRKVGNGDFERTDRQRMVLTNLIAKISKINIVEVYSLLDILFSEIETNLSKSEIIKFGSIGLISSKNSVDEIRLPYEGTYQHKMIRGMAVLVPDMEKNKEILHQFIYNRSPNEQLNHKKERFMIIRTDIRID